MTHPQIIHNEIPFHLFKSDFLEFFTQLSPITILVIWAPIILALLFLPSAQTLPVMSETTAGVLIGLFTWTLAEYLLHRFLFHYKATSPRMERLTFLFHGVTNPATM